MLRFLQPKRFAMHKAAIIRVRVETSLKVEAEAVLA
jgi:hypothetical protein